MYWCGELMTQYVTGCLSLYIMFSNELTSNSSLKTRSSFQGSSFENPSFQLAHAVMLAWTA
jgi:hypothetical protein